MKYFKIYGSILLVLMITLTPVSSRADESFSYSSQAQTLNDMGLYAGTSTETFEPDLGAALNRESGVVMMLRLFGLEQEAEALSDEEVDEALSGFSDADQVSDWARRSMAYAVANGLVVGCGGGILAPCEPMQGKAYCSLLLRQLGYHPEYDNAATELAARGGLTSDEAARFQDRELIRDDLVGISFGALGARDPAGSTVIGNLVTSGRIQESEASRLGLPVPAPAPIVVAPPAPVVPTPPPTSTAGRSGGSSHDYVTPNITMIGLQNSQAVIGQNSLPFSVSLIDAVLSGVSDNPAISEIVINNSNRQCSLQFTATQTGIFTITINAVRPGYNPASQQINVTVENHAPTVKAGEGTQTGTAVPAANSGNPAAVKYTTADVSAWFEAADTQDTLWYYPISAVDQDLKNVSNGVGLKFWPSEGKIEYMPAAAQASKTVTIVVKAMDSKTKTDSTSNVTITVNVGAIPIDALANGLSFKDDDANNTDTIIILGAPSEVGNTFVYKISEDANAVPPPHVGDDLSAWIPVTNGASITAANGKHIGVAEVDGSKKAVQFSDAVAVTEAEIGTLTVSADVDNANDTNTIIIVTEVNADHSRLYKNFGKDEVTLPMLDTVLTAEADGWIAFPANGSIAAANGDKIVVVDVLTADNKAKYVGQTVAVVKG